MKRAVSLVAFSLAVLTSALAADKPTCAVLTFQPGTGCTAEEAKFVSDRFAALLTQLDTYNVLARSEMGKILAIQKWNLSDYCSATACAIEAGKILSVQYVIFGTVGHIGTLYSMNTSLVEVESARVVKSAVTDYQGALETFVKAAPAENIRSLLVRGQTPEEWDRLPTALAEAVPLHAPVVYRTPKPAPKPPPSPQAAYIGPRVGVSMLTAMVGIEAQFGHLAFDLGLLPAQSFAAAVRFYFEPQRSSWFVAAGHFSNENDTTESKYELVGMCAGYRWRFGTGWDLSFALGAGRGEDDDGTEVKKSTDPYGELAFGYSF